MKLFMFLFFLISLSHIIRTKTLLEDLSKKIKTFEGSLLYYYIHNKNKSRRNVNQNTIIG